MSNNNPSNNDDHDHATDIDIDQDFSFDLDQETKLDVDTEHSAKSEYEVKVDAKDAEVKVDIEIKEDKEIKQETSIKFEETVKKDIDIKIDEQVDKDINIDVWETHVDVKAENIIQDVLYDEDVNDIDSQKLLNASSATINMDDFTARQLANGNSFNGSGNDLQFSVRQANQMRDNDTLSNPVVAFGADGPSKIEVEAGRMPPPPPPHHGGGSDPFQKVKVEGGSANAYDGIKGDVSNSANGNAGDGSVSGSASASADAIANVAAFTQDIVMGGNTQGNFTTLNVTGGDLTQANDIGGKHGGGDHDGGWGDDDEHEASRDGGYGGDDDGGLAIRNVTFENDVNDLDAQELLNAWESEINLDDFSFDTTANGDSFNGPGNDMQFDVGQVNDLVDEDHLNNPQVLYNGPAGSALQDVYVAGGEAHSGSGINGYVGGTANNNGGNGSISGSTSASADAVANVSAFTQNIVMGANLQVNNFTATVVGGDAVSADDITGI